MDDKPKIGIDLGGTNVRAGLVENGSVNRIVREKLRYKEDKERTLNQLKSVIQKLNPEEASGIGIGVPSVVDTENGIVYDVVNIPSWKEVHLKKILENTFNLPVHINNDVNCFILGEHQHGAARGYEAAVALSTGTGLGAGIVINNTLYNGNNSGAGEIGLIPYLDHDLEFYCSSAFFSELHNVDGENAYIAAIHGDKDMVNIWNTFGKHMAQAIKTIVLAYDPQIVILGGSISSAYSLFKDSMHEHLKDFAFKRSIERLVIRQSENKDSSILGAASLF